MAGWHHWLDRHESEWTLGIVMDREACHAAIHGVAKSRTRLSDWTELNWTVQHYLWLGGSWGKTCIKLCHLVLGRPLCDITLLLCLMGLPSWVINTILFLTYFIFFFSFNTWFRTQSGKTEWYLLGPSFLSMEIKFGENWTISQLLPSTRNYPRKILLFISLIIEDIKDTFTLISFDSFQK